MKITEDLKNKWLDQGYIIQRSKIEGVSKEPELIPIPAVHVPELIPDIQLSSNVIQIINALESGEMLYEKWFDNNISWVRSGHISEQEFLTSYYSLIEQGVIHPPIIEEVLLSVNLKISFTNPNIGGFSSSIPIEDTGELQGIMNDRYRNKAKFTLIGSSTNQPISTLNELINNINDLLASVEPEPEPEPEPKETWWVIRPSGLIEQVTVTQKFVDTMTAQGWIFSKDKPTIEEPQNQNISIVFYIGKGGDLKTHFGITSIIVTPDEAELLAGWLYQNYNTKILFVMNRLTDDVRTHTLQQIKDLIIQKLKDDEPESDDITPADIKKPQELGFMGAGIAGAIAGLVLIGFIADHKRGK